MVEKIENPKFPDCFKDLTENTFKTLGYKERKDEDSRTYINWYYQIYSAMNMITDAQYFDITGGQYWITIPCIIEEYENFFIQLNIRHFDNVSFRGNSPEYDLNAITAQIFFIDGTDWSNLGVYAYKSTTGLKKPKDQKLSKKYIDTTRFYRNHWKFYDFSTGLVDYLVSQVAHSLDDFLNKDFANIGSALYKIKQTKSANQRRKIFNKEIKPLMKLSFGNDFSIR